MDFSDFGIITGHVVGFGVQYGLLTLGIDCRTQFNAPAFNRDLLTILGPHC
jgi:hypothetical protein